MRHISQAAMFPPVFRDENFEFEGSKIEKLDAAVDALGKYYFLTSPKEPNQGLTVPAPATSSAGLSKIQQVIGYLPPMDTVGRLSGMLQQPLQVERNRQQAIKDGKKTYSTLSQADAETVKGYNKPDRMKIEFSAIAPVSRPLQVFDLAQGKNVTFKVPQLGIQKASPSQGRKLKSAGTRP